MIFFCLTVIIFAVSIYWIYYKAINSFVYSCKYGPYRVISNGYKHKVSRRVYSRFLFLKWENEDWLINFFDKGIEALKEEANYYNREEEKRLLLESQEWKEV